MNGQPHTHQLKFSYHGYSCMPWLVTYGDTSKWVWRGPWLERRLRRAANKMIRRHDRGSIKAQRRVDTVNKMMATVKSNVATNFSTLHEGAQVDDWPSRSLGIHQDQDGVWHEDEVLR